jgi:hypothetical protein
MPRQKWKVRKNQPPSWHLESKKQIIAHLKIQFPELDYKIMAQRWETQWRGKGKKPRWQKIPARVRVTWKPEATFLNSVLIRVLCKDVTKSVCHKMGWDYSKLKVSETQETIEISEK